MVFLFKPMDLDTFSRSLLVSKIFMCNRCDIYIKSSSDVYIYIKSINVIDVIDKSNLLQMSTYIKAKYICDWCDR